MNITLINFRIHNSRSFFFPDEKVTYISGNNGVGKTTIFHAIQWVLYGKIQKIAPRRKPGANVKVVLETSNMIITRIRKPSNVFVEVAGYGRLEGAPAQSWIDANFGHNNTWMYTSYLVQDKLHLLLEQDPSTRMKILNQIVFDGDDPTDTINSLSLGIKELESKISVLSVNERNTYQQYQLLLNANPGVQESWILADEELEELEQTVKDIEAVLPQLTTESSNSSHLLGRFNALESTLAHREKEIASIPSLQDLISRKKQLELDITAYNQYTSSKSNYDKISQEIFNISQDHPQTNNLPQFSREQIISLTSDWNQYHYNRNLAQSIPITYSKEVIDEDIEKSVRIRDNQWMFNSNAEVAQLSARIDQLRSTVPNSPSVSLSDAQTTIKELLPQSQLISKYSVRKAQLTDQFNQISSSNTSELNEKLRALSDKLSSDKLAINTQFYNKKNDINSSITSVNERITHSNLSRVVQPCPLCNGSLKIVNNLIQSSQHSRFDEVKHNLLVSEVNRLRSELSDVMTDEARLIRELDNSCNQERMRINTHYQQIINSHRQEVSNKLSEIDRELSDEQQSINKTRREMEDIISCHNKISATTEQINELTGELSKVALVEIPPDLQHLTPQQLMSLNNKISLLHRIVVVDKPSITVDDAVKSNKWHQVNSRLLDLREQLSAIILPQEPITKPFGDVSMIQSMIDKRTVTEDVIASLKKDLFSLGDKPDIRSLLDDIKTKNEILSSSKMKLNHHRVAQSVKSAYNSAYSAHCSCKSVSDDLIDLRDMRNIAINKQSLVHQKLVTNINNFLKVAVPRLFDEPISILVNTSKQNKLGAEVSSVNLQISYQGDDDVDLSSLSGGEKRKISALISLAFSGSFKSKMMILDESIACLDSETRVRLINVIKEVMKKKIVIITCHGIQTGIFDQVIDLTKI